MDLAQLFDKIVLLVRESTDPTICWLEILRAAKAANPKLENANIASEINGIKQQLLDIWRTEPLTQDTTFLYFGLFDAVDKTTNKEAVGFYLSGGDGTHPEKQLADTKLSYFPDNRFLETSILQTIRDVARAGTGGRDVLEYAVMYGCASVIAKYAVAGCGVALPVYVGFDSGDFALVA